MVLCQLNRGLLAFGYSGEAVRGLTRNGLGDREEDIRDLAVLEDSSSLSS